MNSSRLDENTTWTKDNPRQTLNTTDSKAWTDNYATIFVSCYNSYDHGFMGGNGCSDHEDMVTKCGIIVGIAP
jgi:hypothetical protein